MRKTLERVPLFLVALATLLLAPNIAHGQEDVKRLRSPATARGFIGGESHNSYVIRARRGQMMTVQISWRREHNESGDNRAEFFVSESSSFDGGGQVKFGKEYDRGKRWSGRVLKTGDYYIYVNAHPAAHYTLRVTVR